MGVIENPGALLYTAAGFALYWLGHIVAKWVKNSTERRRAEVDELSSLLTENRRLKESLHEHRVEMIKSGQWTSDTLPPFIQET